MNLEIPLHLMCDIPDGLASNALAGRLREADAALTAAVKARASGRWFPGKGRLFGRALADVREAAVRKAFAPATRDGGEIALVALGGLGRRELAPGSDLDLLVLHAPGLPVEERVRAFLQALWDAGFDVTASTRTIADCLSHAADDVTFFTALLSARFLAGDGVLYARLVRRFSRRVRGTGFKLAAEWLDEARAAANGAPGGPGEGLKPLFAKEPNLKKPPGGLRAAYQIDWAAAVAGRSPGAPDPSRFLTAGEHRRLESARDFLLYLRILLHFEAGGKEDTLALDYQLPLAESLGLAGDEIGRIRSLMGLYYRKALIVHRTLFRFLERVCLERRPRLRLRLTLARHAARRRKAARPEAALGEKGVLYVPAEMPRSPAAAFALLERLADDRWSFSASIVSSLSDCARTVDAAAWKTETGERLRPLLGRRFSSRSLRAMHYAGLLDAVLPALRPVRLFYLYSPAHLLPVDAHAIEAVAALERLAAGELPASVDRLIEPVKETAALYRDTLWALKLALLLHDAGKGAPGDHVKNGVDAAARVLPGLGVNGQIKSAVLFVIEHHLLLSTAARRKDTSDPRVLDDLARVFVFSPYPEEYLDLVYLCTFADVWATNPKYYHGYFALTLARVHRRVREIVMAGARGRASPGPPSPGDAAAAFAFELGGRYREHNADVEVRADYEALTGLPPGRSAVAVRPGGEYLRVKFYDHDRPGLFALFAGILAKNGATIARADIHTWGTKVLDEFFVTRIFESDAGELSENADVSRWEAALRSDYAAFRDDLEGLSARLESLKKATRCLGARYTHPARAEILPAAAGNEARIEIAGRDRPALLFDLAWALSREGADVRCAFIDTFGWYVEDAFEIAFAPGMTGGRREAIRRTLLRIMEGG